MQKYFIAGLAAAAVWFYLSWQGEREAHSLSRADNARLLSSLAAQERAVEGLRGQLADQGRLLAERDANVAACNSVAHEAAITIEGAANDNPHVDLDARLPDSMAGPLWLLYRQAAGGGRAADDSGPSAAVVVSGQAHARAPAGVDRAQPDAVDGQTDALGQ